MQSIPSPRLVFRRGAAAAAVATLTALGFALAHPALAGSGPEYEVTIYNLTRSQVFAPPLVAVHSSDVSVFEPGTVASAGLALLAEDGDASVLESEVASVPGVIDTAVGGDVIAPAGTLTVNVSGSGGSDRLSVAGMLVNTNDAFFALRGATVARLGQNATKYALVWDAGSEGNNESCDFIPGPACDGAGAGVRDTANAEGFIHIHSGVHGVADLDAQSNDWRNPAAMVVVRRVN